VVQFDFGKDKQLKNRKRGGKKGREKDLKKKKIKLERKIPHIFQI